MEEPFRRSKAQLATNKQYILTNNMTSFTSTRLFLLASVLSLLAGCTHVPSANKPSGHLHQVGLVWLKNAGNQEDQQKVIEAIHAFDREIPEVTNAAVGRTDGIGGPFSETGYDLCFILSFEDEAARQRYNVHPTHQKAAQEVFLPLSKKLLFYRFVGE